MNNNKRNQQQKKELNGFEKLVQLKEQRAKKKIEKQIKYQKDERFYKKKNVQNQFGNLRKKDKYDLESLEEISDDGFQQEIQELQIQENNDEQQATQKKKSKQEIYKEIIWKSKISKISKQEEREQLIKKQKQNEKQFSHLREKLNIQNKRDIEKTKINTNIFGQNLIDISKANFLKPAIHQNKDKQHKVKHEDISDSQASEEEHEVQELNKKQKKELPLKQALKVKNCLDKLRQKNEEISHSESEESVDESQYSEDEEDFYSENEIPSEEC